MVWRAGFQHFLLDLGMQWSSLIIDMMNMEHRLKTLLRNVISAWVNMEKRVEPLI